MVFGKSKGDKSQDAQLQQLQKDISICWQWIQQHEKNQAILIKNNSAFIKKNKKQAELNKQVIASVNALVEKDKQHDAKDAEHDALIQGFKNMAKAIEKAET